MIVNISFPEKFEEIPNVMADTLLRISLKIRPQIVDELNEISELILMKNDLNISISKLEKIQDRIDLLRKQVNGAIVILAEFNKTKAENSLKNHSEEYFNKFEDNSQPITEGEIVQERDEEIND